MKYIFSVVEQLDLAAQQLHEDGPAYARFALLLVDNMVELMIHRECQWAIAGDEFALKAGRPRFDAKSRARALGHHVDEKIKFCRDLGVISLDEFDFIHSAHGYRNELYHVGIRHDGLIYPLAWQYHTLACELFAKLKVRAYTWESRKSVRSDAVCAHWPEGARALFDEGAFSSASKSLIAAKPPLAPSFEKQLSRFALQAVEGVDSSLDFLVEDNMSGMGEEEVLTEVQFYAFIRSEDGEAALGFDGEPSFEDYHRRVAQVRESWRPKYTSRPTPRWSKRATALAGASSPVDALRRFVGLRDEMAPFRRMVGAAASALDQEIQHRIDEARGK